MRPHLTKERIESLSTLDAQQAAKALEAPRQNPHIVITNALAQTDFRKGGTGNLVSDEEWDKE